MDEKKKGIIFGVIALVAGVIFITYGVINLVNQNKEEPKDTENNNVDVDVDGPSITVTEDDVRAWLTDNKNLIDYMTNFNTDFDLETATNDNISNIFGWYFVFQYDHGAGEKATDSKYTYRYTMSKADAEVFLQNYLGGVSIDMLDTSLMPLDIGKFTSDAENFYVDVLATSLDPVQNSAISKVEILSDSEIKVTYGIMKLGEICDNDDCYIKSREIILRKSNDSFAILKANDVLGTENNNLEDNQNDDTQEQNNNPDLETGNN